MNNPTTSPIPTSVVVSTAASLSTLGAATTSIESLVEQIKARNKKVRAEAWQNAAQLGAPAIKPLAPLLDDPEIEISRAANRALWSIVRHAGRPGAAQEAKAVTVELVALLSTSSIKIRREALWMISELGADAVVKPVAALLADIELREDARLVLQRIPGTLATDSLKQGLSSVPDDFKTHLAQSLRARGEKVEGYPNQKLIPIKPTSVK